MFAKNQSSLRQSRSLLTAAVVDPVRSGAPLSRICNSARNIRQFAIAVQPRRIFRLSRGYRKRRISIQELITGLQIRMMFRTAIQLPPNRAQHPASGLDPDSGGINIQYPNV
jgi:hypothetical protein